MPSYMRWCPKNREQRRFERQAVTLELLAAAKALRGDLSVGAAREVLWALTGVSHIGY